MATQTLLKLSRRFTSGGVAVSGTAFVSISGTNTPVRLFADVLGAVKFPGTALGLDSDGLVTCYVQPGTYRIRVVDSTGALIAQEDPIIPVADLVDSAREQDAPAVHKIPYAAAVTPSAVNAVQHVSVGILTGNITINAPTKPALGKVLIFDFTQDGTGSRTITWNAVFSLIGANGAGTASQIGTSMFVYNGSKWAQIGGALAFHAP